MVNRSKREYLARIKDRYRHAGRKGKARILDEFCEVCGHHRKHAIRLLNQDGRRDGFNEMIHEYVERGKEDFEYILVLDVSRWGRFQDIDLSAYYSGLCAYNKKKIIFTTIGFPKQDDLLYGVQLSIERYRAASYSRELSGKVWKGCSKIASDGFWAGGKPPYGMYRLLLDEARNPVRILKTGEHKAVHNQRVTLTLGDQGEIQTIRRIFDLFVQSHRVTVYSVRFLSLQQFHETVAVRTVGPEYDSLRRVWQCRSV